MYLWCFEIFRANVTVVSMISWLLERIDAWSVFLSGIMYVHRIVAGALSNGIRHRYPDRIALVYSLISSTCRVITAS